MTTITAGTSVGDPWVEVRRNCVPNGRVGGTNGWAAGRAGTSGHTVALGMSGPRIRATLTTSGGSGGSWWVISDRFALPVGAAVVSLSVRVQASVGNTHSVIIGFYDAAGDSVGSASTPTYTGTGSLATRVLENVPVPAGAVVATVRVNSVGGVDGDYVDGYLWILEAGPTIGPFFSGATANDSITQYVWTGAADASPSIVQTRVTSPTMTSYAADRESDSIVHKLIGGGIATVLYPAALRSGMLQLFYPDEASAFVAFTLLSRACIFTLTESGRLSADMTFTVSDRISVALDPKTRAFFTVTTKFQEVTV